MSIFVVSLIVTLLTIVFSKRQARSYESEYRTRMDVELSSRGDLGIGLSPEVIRCWFDQGLDLASNFPALILTLVAYSELDSFEAAAGTTTLLIAAVVITMAIVMFSAPKYATSARLLDISSISWLVLLLNVAGIAVAAMF